jgi:hypothetical protein
MKEWYIVHGARIKCDFGSHVQRINLPVSHGAYVNGQAALCATDNKSGENIPCFGVCGSKHNRSAEPLTLLAQGFSHKTVTGKPCVPVVGEWQNTKEGVLIWGEEALTTASYLICNKGGRISFEDSGQRQESRNPRRRRPPDGDGELVVKAKKLGTKAPEKQIEENSKPVSINKWLTGHTEKSGNGGRDVYPPDSREDFKKIYSGENGFAAEWFSFEGREAVSKNFPVQKDRVIIGPYGEFIDPEGRYWVAVGPNVMNPKHVTNSDITQSEMNYGAKIDVRLRHMKTAEECYIYARVGDVKAHTGAGTLEYKDVKYFTNGTYKVDGEGIYQTGINAQKEEYLPENADGSMIEFLGKDVRENMSEYELLSITAY